MYDFSGLTFFYIFLKSNYSLTFDDFRAIITAIIFLNFGYHMIFLISFPIIFKKLIILFLLITSGQLKLQRSH